MEKRHRTISIILSLVFMGAGQLYKRQWKKACCLLTVNIFAILASPVFFRSIQGLVSLGHVPREDHSLYLMINGIIAMLSFVLYLLIYLYNIWDSSKELGKAGKDPQVKDSGFPVLILLPSILLITLVALIPLLFMIALAFTNYDLYNVPPAKLLNWVGIANFMSILTLDAWKKTMLATISWSVIWAVGSVVSTFFLGLFMSIILNNSQLKLRSLFRTIMILPWAIPPFVMLMGFRGFFNASFGPVNIILKNLGLVEIPWFQSVFWSRVMVMIVNLYLGFPFFMILCSGIIQSIDPNLQEAATVDGASSINRFWRITLPLVMYSAAPLLIMSLATTFYNFNGIYLLTGGGPAIRGLRGAGGTDTLISWVFKISFDTLYKYNYAAAISVVIFAIIVFISLWNLRRTRQFKEEGVI